MSGGWLPNSRGYRKGFQVRSKGVDVLVGKEA